MDFLYVFLVRVYLALLQIVGPALSVVEHLRVRHEFVQAVTVAHHQMNQSVGAAVSELVE